MSDGTINFDNEPALRDGLLQSIRNRKLAVVTGAGFSRLASGDPHINNQKIASWDGLLAHGCNYCVNNGLHGEETPQVVELQLKTNGTHNLIGAGQTILRWLDKGKANHRYNWLQSSVGQLKLVQTELVKNLKDISLVLFTVNYENLLEQGTGYESLHWKQYDIIARVLRQDETPHVIHLHGFWKSPESIVLDYSSYRDLTTNLATQGLMCNLFVFHHLLFIGCKGTFEDPHFEGIIDYLLKNYSDSSICHYVLCRTAEFDDYKRLLGPMRILKPIAYGSAYDDLPAFINQLAKDSGIVAENRPIVNSVGKPLGYEASLDYKRPTDIWRMQWKL